MAQTRSILLASGVVFVFGLSWIVTSLLAEGNAVAAPQPYIDVSITITDDECGAPITALRGTGSTPQNILANLESKLEGTYGFNSSLTMVTNPAGSSSCTGDDRRIDMVCKLADPILTVTIADYDWQGEAFCLQGWGVQSGVGYVEIDGQ